MIRSPIIRRILALAILALALVGLHALIIGPVLNGYLDDRRVIDERQAALQRYERIVRELPELEKRLTALKQRNPAASEYLSGKDATLAAAALQDRLKALIQREGGQPKSAQILSERDAKADGGDAKPPRVAVREEAVMHLASLQRILYALESGTPFLFIDNLDIRAITPSRGATADAEDAMLDVRFDVYGYLQGGA